MMKSFSEFMSEGKADQALAAYAKKSGGIDKDDMLAVADMMKSNPDPKDLAMMIKAMDSDPRDGVLQIIQKNDKKLYSTLIKNMR